MSPKLNMVKAAARLAPLLVERYADAGTLIMQFYPLPGAYVLSAHVQFFARKDRPGEAEIVKAMATRGTGISDVYCRVPGKGNRQALRLMLFANHDEAVEAEQETGADASVLN